MLSLEDRISIIIIASHFLNQQYNMDRVYVPDKITSSLHSIIREVRHSKNWYSVGPVVLGKRFHFLAPFSILMNPLLHAPLRVIPVKGANGVAVVFDELFKRWHCLHPLNSEQRMYIISIEKTYKCVCVCV